VVANGGRYGVAFEIGYLFALGTPCIALQTDVRRALPSGNNPMIGQALAEIVADETRLLESVRIAMETPRCAHCAVA